MTSGFLLLSYTANQKAQNERFSKHLIMVKGMFILAVMLMLSLDKRTTDSRNEIVSQGMGNVAVSGDKTRVYEVAQGSEIEFLPIWNQVHIYPTLVSYPD